MPSRDRPFETLVERKTKPQLSEAATQLGGLFESHRVTKCERRAERLPKPKEMAQKKSINSIN